MYTEQQIREFKEKADKWDSLDEKISEMYVNPETEEPYTDEEIEEKGFDLTSIGEAAAIAFGWM